MKRIEPKLLKGFRDYLPHQMIARKQIIAAAEKVFEHYGFSPLQTPALEYAEILLGKYGADAERLLYRFTDNGGRDVCLRYDLTVPLARVAAQYPNLPSPLKRYQIAPVWRAEKPARGRFREFFQCDVDIVGSTSLAADAECVAVDNDLLDALGVTHFQININNRKILTGLLESLRQDGADRQAEHSILRSIDKLPAMGEEAVRRLLAEENQLEQASIDHVFAFLGIAGSNDQMLAGAGKLVGASEVGCQGVEELRQVVAYAVALGVPADRIHVDFSIARGLDYYTGSVFETFLLDLPGFGSVMSGGRYDDLISTFLGREMPAVGISMGMDRLFSGMAELGLIEETKTPTRVLVALLGPELLPDALATAGQLRKVGLPTEVYFDNARLKKQLKYANNQEIEAVVILGPDEVATGQATVKLMETGEQTQIPLSNLAQQLSSLIA